MTSKDQTIKRIEFQQEQNEKDQKAYGRTSLFDRLELQYLEGILKDLKVLEIFRDKLNIVLQENFLSCYGGDTITKEEYELLREWLENEK